jgi:hypothetical protein
MPRKRRHEIMEIKGSDLPEGWKIIEISDCGESAIVEIPIDDLKEKKVRIVKLPEAVREYYKQRMREHRTKLRENNRRQKSA